MWSDSMHTLMWKLAFLLAFILTVCFSAQAQHNPGTFTATGSMATARCHNSATLLNNGQVLITGGVGNYNGPDYLSSAELYNPSTGTFTATGSLITARDSHTATLLNNGLVLISGGYGSAGDLSSAELYNPSTGAFTSTGSLNTARIGHSSTLLNNGSVLITGGKGSNGYLTSTELYNPSTAAFTSTG